MENNINGLENYPTDAISLTKKLVSISSTDPGDYEIQIGNYISNWLKYHNISFITEEVLDGRFNIMATLPSENPNISNYSELVYICHMDTVVIGSGWSMDALTPYEIDGKIYGRGACDMKSGLACAMSALKKYSKQTLNLPFKLICTVDEEDFMRGVEKAIQSGWVSSNSLVLDTEPTDNQIQVAHKGRVWVKVDVQGKTAHASRPHMGIDAVAGISEFISIFRQKILEFPKHEELGNSTVTFGQIQGGYRPYVVPDSATVWIDIRTVPPLTSEKIENCLQETISKVKETFNGIEIKYEFNGNRPFIEKDPNSYLLQKLKATCEEILSKPQEVSYFTGYTDTAVIAGKLNNKNCMSYGPGSLNLAHKPDEYVPIEDIKRCEKVLQKLIENTCK